MCTLIAKISRIVSELRNTHTEEQNCKHGHSCQGEMCSLNRTHSERWVRGKPTALTAVNTIPVLTCCFHTEILCFSLKNSVGSWYCYWCLHFKGRGSGRLWDSAVPGSRSGLTLQGPAPLTAWLLTPLSGSSLWTHPCRLNCDSSSQMCWRLCLCINKPKCIWK